MSVSKVVIRGLFFFALGPGDAVRATVGLGEGYSTEPYSEKGA